jgi:hypothetical protein
MYVGQGEVHHDEKEGLMAPPRELWALFGGLRRLLKTGFGRPGTAPGVPPESEVEDSSDLLKRRMRAMHLDPDDLVRSPARTANVKTGLCARCEARGKCMRDLDDEFADPGWGDWRNYCPNATALSLLSTLRECDEERVSHQADQPSV